MVNVVKVKGEKMEIEEDSLRCVSFTFCDIMYVTGCLGLKGMRFY